jgi:hypothetical protein
MADSKVIAFRFEPELMQRIDRYAARVSELAGIKQTRAQVVKKLLALGLDAAEKQEALKHRK